MGLWRLPPKWGRGSWAGPSWLSIVHCIVGETHVLGEWQVRSLGSHSERVEEVQSGDEDAGHQKAPASPELGCPPCGYTFILPTL